ncbi:hypothetical protein FZEAL_683 [Fusarium zealandicum]|uniref:Transcription factor Iwr1 domain-containing protein n=1 Tax=Fusarium zealandicum TaxID=1053134 RepID=A0A8H4XPK3_9HYPO|nr:hypothetical protein FZEAL_683 [Fusarium zealandicum]
MSIPPQLIRVKRKRDDESPVTFLQFDEGAKRHRTGNNWVYQRRQAGPQSPTEEPTRSLRDAKPVIHVSGPRDDASQTAESEAPAARATSVQNTTAPDASRLAQPRRFHISRKMMMTTPPESQPEGVGLRKKKGRYGPAVFVERSHTKATKRASRALKTVHASVSVPVADEPATMAVETPPEDRRLKKPGVRSRQRSPQPDANQQAPLPVSAGKPHAEDMSKIAADMNDWVMKEIGANLQEMEQEKQKSERARFKPKAPTKRFQERHPEVAASVSGSKDVDVAMSDVSDMEDDDDWVIEEYVRVPAHAMAINVSPTDVGVLVFDGEGDTNLFFGPDEDEDEFDDGDEDENAENYYTADYPEDEVESDDEYGRQPYGYRNGNASDDEEFDNNLFNESDDEMVLEGDNDNDATMARIKAYMKRSRAFK